MIMSEYPPPSLETMIMYNFNHLLINTPNNLLKREHLAF
jgi:hypothetical protein